MNGLKNIRTESMNEKISSILKMGFKLAAATHLLRLLRPLPLPLLIPVVISVVAGQYNALLRVVLELTKDCQGSAQSLTGGFEEKSQEDCIYKMNNL